MDKLFVEIGVSDFDTLLPLCQNDWRGLFVEPIHRYAEYLRQTIMLHDYRADVVEKAVTVKDQPVEMIECLDTDEQWMRGISHMDVQSGLKLLDLKDNQYINRRKITVEGIRLDTLLEQKKIKHIDFLKIDIEGHERDVLDDYSWSVKPTMIKIEHKHIDSQSLSDMLRSHDYTVWTERDDLYAIR